ncbi:DNA polymerase III subunit beta [Inmirania thermothiophila]|uniref:Beta sliding clamp n=1 Tax=Inmirania thermothiophila TaxID=1750597 RepID=A0A3N1Y755_9GAMM|nr:DNA polymerase III subunit beta [Inmirania thermothiophila]ROR34358.1 DNA polymerase III beta subunit [Inmirania thermothiophila]
MKIEVVRDTLLRPAQRLSAVVERRQTQPILGHLLCRAEGERLTLVGTDLELEMMAEVAVHTEVPGEVTVPARKLHEICRSLPEGAVMRLEAADGRVVVRAGRSRFVLVSLPPEEFPRFEAGATVRSLELERATLRQLIERTQFAMAHQDVRYYLNGLLLELRPGAVRAVATDGHRLALAERPAETGVEEQMQVIVPRKGVTELARILGEGEDGTVRLGLGSTHLELEEPGLRLACRLIDGRFPDYERVLPAGGERLLEADREALREALLRASILSSEKFRGVRFRMGDGVLRMEAQNPEQEQAEEELEVAYEGDPLEIGFNAAYILDALNALPGERVRMHFTDANSSALIVPVGGEDSRYVVMPMRL